MKKIFSVLLLLTLSAGFFQARAFEEDDYYDYPNDLGLSYGFFPLQDLFGGIVAAFVAIPAGASGNKSELKSIGVIGLSYNRTASKLLDLGGVVNFSRVSVNSYKKDEDPSGTINSTSIDFYLAMFTLKLYWFRYPAVAMYSKFGLGGGVVGAASVVTDNWGRHDRSPYSVGFFPAAQISPVCVEAGGRLRVFAELGFGMEGIGNFGLKYYF